MITLIRMIYIKVVRTKWEFAIWYELNKQLKDLVNNPEKIEKKILPYLTNLVHDLAMLEKQKMANGTYVEK